MGGGEHDAGQAVVGLLAGLPPERRDHLRAIVREGRGRLRETDLGERDMELDGEAGAELSGASGAPPAAPARASTAVPARSR